MISQNAPVVHVHSDASGNFGCGAVTGDARWLQVRWPDSWANVTIAVKEMAPMLWQLQCGVIPGTAQGSASIVIMLRLSLSFRGDLPKDPTLLHLLRCLYFYYISVLILCLGYLM